MKKQILILIIFLLAFYSHSLLAQQDPFLKDYLERWETSRKYMIEVAESMPESEYNFKPTPELNTFAQQLMHIAAIIDWHAFSKTDGRGFKPRYEDFEAEGRSKKEIIEILNREFDRVTILIKEFNPKRLDEIGTYAGFTRTRRQFFMLMADHVTHHRAQILIYLRLKGIIPPKYWEFQ